MTDYSFDNQVQRLLSAGYSPFFLSGLCEALLQKVKLGETGKEPKEKKRLAVIPYIHKPLHNVKKVAARYDVNVVFSAPCKLAKICPMVNRKKQATCAVNHSNQYTKCRSSGLSYSPHVWQGIHLPDRTLFH